MKYERDTDEVKETRAHQVNEHLKKEKRGKCMQKEVGEAR